MKVHTGFDQLSEFRNGIITIGTFDGVHLAHRKLIRRINDLAKNHSGESVIITFHPHPRSVVHGGKDKVKMLTTMSEKIALLTQLGVGHLVVTEFSDEFSRMLPETYVTDFLVAKFHPKTLVIGYNHRFGVDRSGDVGLLRKLAKDFNFNVELVTRQTVDEMDVSSTKIRQAILQGNTEEANRMLGYKFSFTGTVVHGDERGRSIGFPTANIRMDDEEKIVPMDGVYGCRVNLGEKVFPGMMNIGYRPTVDGVHHITEVHLIDFTGDLYDQKITVEPVKLIRREMKFSSVDALAIQLRRDKTAALALLAQR